MPSSKTKKLLAIASAGGHWVQLGRLSPAFANCDTLYVTTLQVAAPPSGDRPVIQVPDASRSEPLRLAALWVRLFLIILKFRPNVLVTTGAAPGLIAIQISRFLGARTIWIDSIANADALSMSGKLAERFADLRLTQWPELAETNPNLYYYGQIL